MTHGPEPDVGFHSDMDGDRWMHSDDERSVALTVAVGSLPGERSERAKRGEEQRQQRFEPHGEDMGKSVPTHTMTAPS